MRALIEPQTNRVAQVEAQDFPVAAPLFWTDCADDVKPETHFWNGSAIEQNPEPAPLPAPVSLTDMILANPAELAKLKAALGVA